MTRLAVEAGVQHADVEQLRVPLRIATREILGDRTSGESLAVNGDAELFDNHALCTARRKGCDILRQAQAPGDLAGGIVVAGGNQNRNGGSVQPLHLPDEIESGVVVAPVAVKKVAGKQHEIDLLGERQLDKILEGPSRGAADLLDGRALVTLQAAQWTVEVAVGGMDEFQ